MEAIKTISPGEQFVTLTKVHLQLTHKGLIIIAFFKRLTPMLLPDEDVSQEPLQTFLKLTV